MTRLFFIVFSSALLFGVASQAADVTGVPRIVDGDTLVIGSTKIRLEGIDAPETDQVCLDEKGARWTCGIEARNQLATHIAGHEISCSSEGKDIYKRTLGICSFRGEDLNGWMVHEGWALAYVKYSTAYHRVEDDAKAHERGLWRGAFIAPWDWRHRNERTLILGTYSVPISAQSLLLPRPGTDGAPSPECLIKGNVNRNGERIYHLPGQQFYARIQMGHGIGKRWFCTPEEAEAAGWRRALR